MKKLGVLIGRFEPRHLGHNSIIKQAAKECGHLLVLIGSANRPRSVRNPWTYMERLADLRVAIPDLIGDNQGFSVYPVNDYRYSNTQWVSDVEGAVGHLMESNSRYFHPDIWDRQPILFGHTKPDTGYLKDFPHWGYKELHSEYEGCATHIREQMFTDLLESSMCPDEEKRASYLRKAERLIRNLAPNAWMSDIAQELISDYEFLGCEKSNFADYPYLTTLQFNCADAVVECAGHILLVKRGNSPGKGLWALPGGFKERGENFFDCAVRELLEETNIRIPDKVLRGSLVKHRLFDDPNRGLGIPRVTVAYHFRVDPDRGGALPRVAPQDDAMETMWVPFKDLLNNFSLHDDHQDIVYEMLNAFPVPAHLSGFNKFTKTV